MAVLKFLNGKPFNDLVVCWLYGLRPSLIYVTSETSDRPAKVVNEEWAVTVILDGDVQGAHVVKRIIQLVQVSTANAKDGKAILEATIAPTKI